MILNIKKSLWKNRSTIETMKPQFYYYVDDVLPTYTIHKLPERSHEMFLLKKFSPSATGTAAILTSRGRMPFFLITYIHSYWWTLDWPLHLQSCCSLTF